MFKTSFTVAVLLRSIEETKPGPMVFPGNRPTMKCNGKSKPVKPVAVLVGMKT